MLLRNKEGARIHVLAYRINGMWHWKFDNEETTHCKLKITTPVSSGRENLPRSIRVSPQHCHVCRTVNYVIPTYTKA